MANGSGLSTPPVALLNFANGYTKKYFTPRIPDSIFRPSPWWWSVTRMGDNLDGGGAIVWTPITSEPAGGGAFYGTQFLDTAPTDPFQPAEIQWKWYYQPIVIPIADAKMNEGEGRVVSMVKALEEAAMGGLLQKVSRGLQGVSPQNTALDFDSIPAILGALGGSYAGLTLADPWASNGGAGPSSGGGVSMDNMMADYMSASQGNEQPDRIFTTAAGYRQFWSLLTQTQRQVEDSEIIRAGFKMHFMFNNAAVMWDGFVPAGEMHFITSKYFSPVFLRSCYFLVDDFLQATNQWVLVSKIIVAGNIRALTLRQHARRSGIVGG